MDLALLVNQFNVEGRLVTIVPFGNGNINDTFLAVYRNTFTETQVIVQRVNRAVFTQPEAIMRNMHNITLHCHEKLEADAAAGRDDRVWQMPRIIKTKDGADYVTDDDGDVWRVITRILSAHAFNTAQSPEHVLECGSTLGHFHYLVSDMDTSSVVNPLPGFHVTSGYLRQYDETLETSAVAKELLSASMEARRLAKFIEDRRDFAVCLEKAETSGELKRRMFHGDPKVNNIMIDDFTGKGTAMIDLDTVSPGLAHIDFGDAIRFAANFVEEDCPQAEKAGVDLNVFWAFAEGFLGKTAATLTENEIDTLALSSFCLACELSTRFLDDYIMGDKYFKIKSNRHNLERTRCQIALAKDMLRKMDAMNAIVRECAARNL